MGVWIPVLLLVLTLPLPAQPTFTTDTNLVVVRFSVMRDRLFVTNLKPSDIILTENDEPRPLALFESPVSGWHPSLEVDLRILIDVSGTVGMMGMLPAKTLRKCLIDQMPGHATLSIYAFARDCKRLCPPTRDPAVLDRAIEESQRVYVRQDLPSASFIYASIVQVAREAAADAPNRRTAIIVLSDGIDNGDRKFADAVAAAREADIVIYPIVVGHRVIHGGRPFFDLGEHTGGRGFYPPNYRLEHLSRIFQHVATQARAEYTTGYYAQPNHQQRLRREVQVRLKENNGLTLYGGVRTVTR
jgi:VWFA-related protein